MPQNCLESNATIEILLILAISGIFFTLLSGEGFGAEISVINTQSYPTLGGNWTVTFNTTGTADLTIKAINGTEFGKDIEFLELRCEDDILTTELTDGAVFVENYSCDGTSHETSKVLSSGKHALESRFGDDIEYAFNQAGDDYFYSESESESTTTSTSYVNKTILQFTLSSAGNYTILATAELQGSSTSYDMKARLFVDGTTYAEYVSEADEAIYHNYFIAHRTMELGAGTHTLIIQYAAESGQTTYIRRARIASVKVTNFEFGETDAEQSLGTTYADIATLTFSVGTAGEYLIIGSAEYRGASTSYSVFAQTLVDGTSIAGSLFESQDTADYKPHFTANITNLTAGSHTIKVQGRSESGTMYMRRARISAIPLSDNFEYYIAASESETTNGATTPTNKTVLTFTPSSQADYLVLSIGILGGDASNGAAYNAFSDTQIDSTVVGDGQFGIQDDTDRHSILTIKNITLDANPHTINRRYWSGSSASPDTSLKNTRIIVLLPKDKIPPTWQNQGEDTTTPGVGEPVELYAEGKDERALDWAVLSTNESGGIWENKTVYDSPMDMGDTANAWNQSTFTWQNSSVAAGTTVGWRIWYNDTSGNWNVTDIRTFTVQVAVPDTLTVSGIGVAPDNVTQGDTNKVMLNMSFSDGSGTVYIEVINVTLGGSATDSDVSGVKIYEDVNSNGVYDSGVDTQLNETKTFSAGEVSFGTPGTAMLTVGSAANKSVLVMYDISGSATLDNTVGASITSASYIGVTAPDTVASTNFPIDSGTSVILELSLPPAPTTIKVTLNRMVILDDPMVNLGESVSCGMSGAGSGYWDTDYWNGEHTTIRAYALAMNQSLVMEGINITFNLTNSSGTVNVNSSLTDSSGTANYSFNMNDLGHGTDGAYTITALNSTYSLSSAVIFTYTYFGCANCHGDPGTSDMNSIGWTTDARSPYSLNANAQKLRMHENPSISAHTSYIESEDCTYCHMSYGTPSDESIGDTSPNTQQYPLYPWGVHSDDIGSGVVCWKCHPDANVSGQTPPIRGCFNATSCHGSITYSKNTNLSTFNTLSGNKAIYSDTYPATGQPLRRHIPGIQWYPDLWELNVDEPAPVDFTSGLNSTANTFGPGAGNDGWDWEDSAYGVSGSPPASFVTHGDPSGSSDYTASGRVEIKVGGSGSGTTDYIASGAWGVQFSITSDEYSKIQGGGEAYVSFDWIADDLDGDLEEGAWIKARFGNSTSMTHLGGDQDSGQTYSDTTNEIWASVDNPSSGFSDPTTGTLDSDVTSMINAAGEYYLDFGGKVDWLDADSNGKGADEGLGVYFDNIQLKIVERENAVTCILCHQPMHNISKPGLTPSQAESSSFSNSYTEDYFCKSCHSPRTEHNTQVKCTVCHSQDAHNVGFFDAAGSYTTNNSNAGDCTTCHQQTAAWNTLLTQPKVGTYSGSGPPQVPAQINHSDNATGQRWGSYWTTGNDLSACNYCHGDTKHSSAALGRPANWSGANTINSSINATNNWCAGCHYQGYTSGSDSYSDMPPEFTGDGLSAPPEITSHSSYAPTGTAGYFNHSLGSYSDKMCSYCHDGLASSATNITAFVHNVGTGRQCENCHFNWSKMNDTFGKPTAYMSETLFGESVHGRSDVFPSVIFCTSCHTKLSNGTDYHLSIDPGVLTPPQSGWKWCEDCHVVNQITSGSNRHNITSDPPSNMFNSTDSVMDVTDCTTCHNATMYDTAVGTFNKTSGKDCRFCHTFPEYDPESPY